MMAFAQKDDKQLTTQQAAPEEAAAPRRMPAAPVQLKDGNTPDGGAKKDDEKELTEAQKVVKAKWEKLLGNWLGGELAKLVLEHVSLDALNGYVADGLKAAGPALGDALKKEAKPDKKQEAALKEFSDALSGEITGLVDKWMSSPGGQKILSKISGFVQGKPIATLSIVGAALIGGALAVWFTNQDLPNIEVPLGLGKGWQAKVGLDLGTIQQLGFQGASLVVANEASKLSIGAEVKKEEETNDDGDVVATTHSGSVTVAQGEKDKESLKLVLNGSIKETEDGLVAHTVDGKLKLVDPDNGVTINIGADGSWDSKGNKSDKFSYTMASGKDAKVSGSLSLSTANVTIVDKDGNIVTTQASELKVAVGDKATKFEASYKSESKDGETTNTVGVSGKGQLGVGTLFHGGASVSVGDDVTTVKLNGGMTATIGGKAVTFDAAYETDGPITGKIKVGEGDEYVEIIGEKKGDIVTFKTKQVFGKMSVERATRTDGEGGVSNQTTVGMTDIGGTGINATAHAGDEGVGGGVTYEEDWLKAHLDFTMKDGQTTMNTGVSVNTEDGFKFDTDLKLADDRIQELGVKLGYRDPAKFRTFLVGYKQQWLTEHNQYGHHFDALLEYSLGRWSTRIDGGIDLRGGQIQKSKLDMSLGYGLNKDWTVFGGMQMNGQLNTATNQYDMGYKPYVGLQYGNIGVAGYFDSANKGGGVMLTIPLGKR